jgi:hypothetical protein
MIASDVAAPMMRACRKSRLGSDRNSLAAMPSPSAIKSPKTAARTTFWPCVMVARIKAIEATNPSEDPKIAVVTVALFLSMGPLVPFTRGAEFELL